MSHITRDNQSDDDWDYGYSDYDHKVSGMNNGLVNINDINITCDAALDSDVSQEIGFLGEEQLTFMEYEEQKDMLVDVTNDDPLFALQKSEELMDQMATVGNNVMFGAIGGIKSITNCMEDVSE